MPCQYLGFRVKLRSTELGEVIGTVCNVTESKIELTDARVNDAGDPVSVLSVESQFIEDLRILATATWNPSVDVTPNKSQEKTQVSTGRAHRREMLRNIPNACSAYVCPDSPPLIHRSAGAPGHAVFNSGSPRQKIASGLQQLDSALADITLNDRKTSRYGGSGALSKRRSYSMSETHAASSDISGTECDLSHPTHDLTSRGHYQNGGQHHNAKSHSRTGRLNNRGVSCGGGSGKQARADWDQVRVEEFMDQDFDFEKNLAVVDKPAFYEMVDMRKGISSKHPGPSRTATSSSTPLDEGPDGVGRPLIGTVPHSERVPRSTKDYYDGCTMTTNTATLSSSRQRHEHSVPYYHPSLQPSSIGDHCTQLCTCSSTVSTSHLTQPTVDTTHRWWYSPIGARIPVLSTADHNRMLHYLATGTDPANLSGHSPASGLSWGRMLETAGRSFVDYIMQKLRHATITPQRSTQRPPPRILLLACGPCLCGAFTVTLARLLATRGACVVLRAPRIPLDPSPDETKRCMDLVYQNELGMCAHLAPRPNLYGLEEDDPFRTNDETDDDEDDEPQEDISKSIPIDKLKSGATRPGSRSDGDSEPMSCMTLDQLSSHQTEAVDYNLLTRMWISRIPGLKRIRRPASIAELPTNVRIDMVIVGHSFSGQPGDVPPLDPQIIQWLQRHSALNCLVHLMPQCTSFIDQYGLRTASANWVVELGLPRLVPSTHADCIFNAPTTSHLLLDVGLSRNLVRRLTSDLELLPPYGLFEAGSVLPLHSTVPSGSN
ncbi:unnamed protein product [Dicrocoelium dendriticum]|nr:unnamed protein product [Dicrocoelium dendriticum]CAH8480631.1 unnamed protein product [Dicrocoelium dendriticum]